MMLMIHAGQLLDQVWLALAEHRQISLSQLGMESGLASQDWREALAYLCHKRFLLIDDAGFIRSISPDIEMIDEKG